MAFAQLTWRESLRDNKVPLEANSIQHRQRVAQIYNMIQAISEKSSAIEQRSKIPKNMLHFISI
jgi:hypothetical protein